MLPELLDRGKRGAHQRLALQDRPPPFTFTQKGLPVSSSKRVMPAGLSRLGEHGLEQLTQLVDELGFSVVPFDRPQADLCAAAYGRFGKGFGSSASLNLCDCAAYTLARSLSLPLLFKGQDFAATDVLVAA